VSGNIRVAALGRQNVPKIVVSAGADWKSAIQQIGNLRYGLALGWYNLAMTRHFRLKPSQSSLEPV
jgi:hypothetical protein